MLSIKPCPLPDHALLATYKRQGAYTDCFATEVSHTISHEEYIQAFYTTLIFKLERSIIKWAVAKPSSDDEVNLLAAGATDTFSAWSVEDRSKNQLLMCDFKNKTRSWLMIESIEKKDGKRTRLYFGSAVVPDKNLKPAQSPLGAVFKALHWFHLSYSRILLLSAKLRLSQNKRN